MAWSFSCPHCGTTTLVNEEMVGQSGSCKNCGKPITVTVPVSADHSMAAPTKGGGTKSMTGIAVVIGFATLALCGLPIVLALLLPAVQMSREAARRIECGNNLRQIALAMNSYHSIYHSYPPAYLTDAAGRPMHSWRVLLLPYMNAQYLYDQYDFSQPWDSPVNQALAARMPESFHCPTAFSPSGPSETSYVVVVCDDHVDAAQLATMFPGARALELGSGFDPPQNTILVVESTDHSVNWLEPSDVTVDQLLQDSTHHPGGFNAAMADGSVRFISKSVSPERLRGLLSPAGNESINW